MEVVPEIKKGMEKLDQDYQAKKQEYERLTRDIEKARKMF